MPGNRKLVDELCWDIDSAAESSLLYRSTTATADAFAGGSDYPNRSETNGMLMGFTWAPPVEEWGYSIYEEECVLGVCVELLEARIGYNSMLRQDCVFLLMSRWKTSPGTQCARLGDR